jgi:CubicO group peptidase (beta-lactamase class C family)
VTWATGAPAVASVSATGVVTGVAAGTTQVTATSEGRHGSANVTVLHGAVLSPAGGVAATADSGAVLTFSAGALAQPQAITLAPQPTPPPHPRLIAGTGYAFGPAGATFAQPVTVRLAYPAAAVAAVAQSLLRVHRYRNGTWEEVGGPVVIDSVRRTVSAQTTSFSSYAIIALPPPVAVATVTVTPDSADVLVQGTVALTATTRDADGTVLAGRSVTWQSAHPAIASVSAAGLVTGVAVGTATITATSEGKQGTARVRVLPVPVASVTVSPGSGEVPFRGTLALSAATRDAGGNLLTGRPVTWLSSDPAVATVSATGVVTGVRPGTVTITATSEGQQGQAHLTVVPADLGQIVDSIRATHNLPALAGAIVTRSGGLVAIGAKGVRRWGGQAQVTVQDKWHLGSISKTFTSFLAALAVKGGHLAWTDLMTSRYPELAPISRPQFLGVTMRDLATMQAGIIGNPGFTPTGTLAQQRTAVDHWAVQQPPAAPLGTYYYSNIAYQIFGEIIGRVFGTGYEQAMRDRVWTPLGITSGGLGPPTGAGMSDQPNGHTRSGSGWAVCEACDNSWATGSGKIHMSLPDLARFVHEVLKADAGQSSFLSQTEARFLTTGVTPIGGAQSYGYGWVVFNQASRPVQHDGSNNRHYARHLLFLEAGVAYLLATNAGEVGGGVPLAAVNALQARLQTWWQTGQ